MKKKIFTVDKWLSLGKTLSIVICWGLLFWAAVEIIEGTYRSDTTAQLAEATSKLLAGENDLYPATSAAYEVEARVVSKTGTDNPWSRGSIVADCGDKIELRLKAMSASPEYVTNDAVHRGGLSVSWTAGLKPMTPTSHTVLLPDGTSSDYMENWDDECVQYYYLGVYKLGLSDWMKGSPASSLRAFNYQGPSATLLVFTPYGEINFWLVLGLLIGAGVCGLVFPRIIQRIRFNLMDCSSLEGM